LTRLKLGGNPTKSNTKSEIEAELMHSDKIELGMKVAVRRGVLEHVGEVTRLEGEHVVVRWIQSEWPEELEFTAHRDDVKPLDGWI
jgi:hypothetical protein